MKIVNAITIEQLNTINTSLASRLIQVGSRLKTYSDNKAYWINVELSDGKMYISADNGFDISDEVEVSFTDMEAIKKFIKDGL